MNFGFQSPYDQEGWGPATLFDVSTPGTFISRAGERIRLVLDKPDASGSQHVMTFPMRSEGLSTVVVGTPYERAFLKTEHEKKPYNMKSFMIQVGMIGSVPLWNPANQYGDHVYDLAEGPGWYVSGDGKFLILSGEREFQYLDVNYIAHHNRRYFDTLRLASI